mmetsp:Transcript_35908/g.113583  ORF Transcript_35908/g.113583 Transcript_35908/m.113583 type:complete len:239 (-) Transcript_35908:1412-2128(-)
MRRHVFRLPRAKAAESARVARRGRGDTRAPDGVPQHAPQRRVNAVERHRVGDASHGVVEDDDGGVPEEHARHDDAHGLRQGHLHLALPDHGVVPVGQLHDEAVRVRVLARPLHVVHRHGGLAPVQHVVRHGAAHEHGRGVEPAYAALQRLVVVLDVHVVDEDRPLVRAIQALEEDRDIVPPARHRAHESVHLPRGDGDAEVLHEVVLGPHKALEPDPVEADGALAPVIELRLDPAEHV